MMKVKSNGHAREVVYGHELSAEERVEFDYYSAEELESATFVRAYGNTYDLGEFSTTWGLSRDAGLPDWLSEWHGFMSESYWSGVLVRYCEGADFVVIGHFLETSEDV